MIVEYVAANAAMALTLAFGSNDAFAFDGARATAAKAMLALLAQHGPELICDAVSTRFEVRFGLPVSAYWRKQRESRVCASKLVYLTCAIVCALLARLA